MPTGVYPRKSLIDRFHGLYIPEPNSGCWLWVSNADRAGYGRFQTSGGKAVIAHRFAYQQLVGPVPEGLELDHKCRVRCCVNPAHLEPVTHAENMARAAGKIKRALSPTCVRGHVYMPETTRIIKHRGKTSRCCLLCKPLHDAASRRKRGAKPMPEAWIAKGRATRAANRARRHEG